MNSLADELKLNVEALYHEFGGKLIQKYGSLYEAFEETAYDPESLEQEGFVGNWIEPFKKIAKENIPIQFVEIKGYLDIRSWNEKGIEYIRKALLKAEESEYEDVAIDVHYIGAPHYSITVKAPDYKIAEEELKKAVSRVENIMNSQNGEIVFHRKLDE
jgi:translation initiation factor 2 subunit 1